MNFSYKIAVVGLWHLGEIFSSGLADLGHQVIGVSEDEQLIANFKKDVPPLPEPDLAETLARNRSAQRLDFSSDFSRIKNCNVLWFTFDTPVNDADESDLGVIYGALEKSMPHLADGVMIVVTSQIPAGTSANIKRRIKEARPDLSFGYVYTPENLRLGEAVRCFKEPGRIIVGAETEEEFRKITEIFSGLKTEILKMSPASAEMGKHALNAFLATSVSFINDVSDVCDKVGADILDVVRVLRSDSRIGPRAFLSAGLGFSGGTLGRDLKTLLAFAAKNNIILPVIDSVYKKNASRQEIILARLKDKIGNLAGRKVAILGLTYKPGTKTLRRSRALEIAKELMGQGAIVRLHDPQADELEVSELIRAEFFKDAVQSAQGASAIVIITPWPEFRDISVTELAKATEPEALLLDTANLLWEKSGDLAAHGFKYYGVGRGN